MTSRAGRDAGRKFAILAVEGEWLALADGQLRRVEKPKRKKLMHVRVTPHILPEIVLLLNDGTQIENHHLRKALKALEEKLCQKTTQ
ncbi:MAG: KOW domain-containing RNA-binding protein [Clostridia bacterium]|nr:KOW domain-containing RNA-binding protein [Clostridia bacterium]